MGIIGQAGDKGKTRQTNSTISRDRVAEQNEKNGKRILREYGQVRNRLNNLNKNCFQTQVQVSDRTTKKTYRKLSDNQYEVITSTQYKGKKKVNQRAETYTLQGDKLIKKSTDNMGKSTNKVVQIGGGGECTKVIDEKPESTAVVINEGATRAEDLDLSTRHSYGAGPVVKRPESDPNRYGDKVEETLKMVRNAEKQNLGSIADPDGDTGNKRYVTIQQYQNINGIESVILRKENSDGTVRVSDIKKIPNPPGYKKGTTRYIFIVEETKNGKVVYTKHVETTRTSREYDKDIWEVYQDSRQK